MNEQNIENVSSLADNQNPASENNQPNIAEKYKQMAINDMKNLVFTREQIGKMSGAELYEIKRQSKTCPI